MLIAFVIAAPLALASPTDIVGECIGAAKSAWAKGDGERTVAVLKKALKHARPFAKLKITEAVVTQKPSRGLGMYEPAKNNNVEFGTLWLYVEVENYATRIKDKRKVIDLSVSGEFFQDGESLGSKELGVHQIKPYTDVGITSFGLDVRLGGTVPKGPYELELTVTDGHTQRRAKKRITFNIL